MGLLEEAIREHLELKRRSGGDPAEIARKEQEALAPVFPEEDGVEDGVPLDGEAPPLAADGELPHAGEPEPPEAPADFSTVGQETAELDMESVLGPEEMMTQEHPAPAARDDVEFEWEAPRAAGEAPASVDPGQERLSFE